MKKKTETTKRMQLRKQAIRQLDAGGMNEVNGGTRGTKLPRGCTLSYTVSGY